MLSRHPRHPVQLPVRFTGDHDGEGIVTNLSLGGCQIEQTDTRIERHAVLTLNVYLSPQDLPVTLEVAVVRWSSELACGVEFFTMTLEAQQRLERYTAGPALTQA